MLPDTVARALRDHLASAHVRVADGEPVSIAPTRPNEYDPDYVKAQVSPVFGDGPGFWLKVGDDMFTVRVTKG